MKETMMTKGKRQTRLMVLPLCSQVRELTLLLLLPLLLVGLLLSWLPAEAQATPVRRRGDPNPCAHKSIAELIRTSPVIVKALGARIFSDADFRAQQGMLTFPSGADVGKSARQTVDGVASAKVAAILITLTPETIYKGASLLKMTPGNEHMSNDASGGGGLGAGAGGGVQGTATYHTTGNGNNNGKANSNSAESAYQYEGQLNATLEPLACFDGNMLKMLPMELIAFGKLLPAATQQSQLQQQDLLQQQQPLQQQQQPQQQGEQQEEEPQQQQQQQQQMTQERDILHISINGLHRWTPQFEHHIWKNLGWDGWSDFTLCSVTCGKGVQQRFRRCLLDNPMVNMNMNMNLNEIDDDDVHNDDDEQYEEMATGSASSWFRLDAKADDHKEGNSDGNSSSSSSSTLTAMAEATTTTTTTTTTDATLMSDNAAHKFAQSDDEETYERASAAASAIGDAESIGGADGAAATNVDINEHESVTFVQHVGTDNGGYVSDTGNNVGNSNSRGFGVANQPTVDNHAGAYGKKRAQHKKRKSAKSLSTLFCEGYNIEQRNCNTFECSDDISDLLKFYKKLPMTDEATAAAAAAAMAAALTTSSSSITTATFENDFGIATAVDSAQAQAQAQAHVQQPSSTPANMGYVHSWRNALNFTLMITMRAKNDTQNTSTLFSIRNATHNLYLEACKDGLRLYLERDNTTEMLPVKFNLYDYRWHQVAISIQNGDFISIYVDCVWTNSFVVSKRLYTLPLDADVEIGRGFNGELQQLLVLPEHQERQQCSNKRTSINEVKRYIIDTFIDDYGN